MSPDWWRDCRDGIEKCSSPTGDGNETIKNQCTNERILRNVVPRQGTETGLQISRPFRFTSIEKCSSPTGDGNLYLKYLVMKQRKIEKCSSPTGDGNSYNTFVSYVSPTY